MARPSCLRLRVSNSRSPSCILCGGHHTAHRSVQSGTSRCIASVGRAFVGPVPGSHASSIDPAQSKSWLQGRSRFPRLLCVIPVARSVCIAAVCLRKRRGAPHLGVGSSLVRLVRCLSRSRHRVGTPEGTFPCCKLTMRSSGPRGETSIFRDSPSARGRLTRR